MEREAMAAATLWGPGFTRFDTAVAPPSEGFDYWCALFPLLRMQPLRRSAPYRSTAVTCAGDDGAVFSQMRADPTATHFIEGMDERVMLSLFVGGGARVRHGRGCEDAAVPAGGFNLLDCASQARTDSPTGHESLHLSFPRSKVIELLGRSPAGDGASFRHLPDSPLGQILKANLVALARHGPTLDASSAARVMEAVGSLAMAYLAQFRAQGMSSQSPRLEQHQFDAACRYVEARLSDPSLTARAVAGAVGCSRAHLYRLFAQRGLSVTNHIREMRLLRSRALLRDGPLGIGDIAFASGYGDLAAFGKAFRRRFGMSPSDWRNEAHPPAR